MNKLIAYISTITLASLIFGLSLGSASALTRKNVVLNCPQDYAQWVDEGQSFFGGYQGVCSYFTGLDKAERKKFIMVKKFNTLGVLASYPKAEWRLDFLQNHWTNNRSWSYRVIN